jgi:hypothetical protein
MPRKDLRNPQTVALLDMLGLEYNLDHAANTAHTADAYTSRTG